MRVCIGGYMPKRVFGWMADMMGCGYYRIVNPYAELSNHGYQVAGDVNWSGYVDSADVVVAQRTCKLDPSTGWQRLAWLKRQKKHNKLLVYEIDDDFLSIDRDKDDQNVYHYFTHPEIQNNIIENVKAADLVTVSTDPLAEVLRPYNDNIVVIPNYIDATVMDTPAEIDFGSDIDREKSIIIGYTGSLTHRADFNTIQNEMAQLLVQNDPAWFLFMGHLYENNFVKSVHLPFQNIIEGDYFKTFGFDIGIAPLLDTKFNQSKSYIKALEYAAFGIPCVASNVGPYRDFVQHGETGFLFNQPYQFTKYMRDLINDADMRKEMGAKAKEYAKKFTIQEHYTKYIDAYGLDK